MRFQSLLPAALMLLLIGCSNQDRIPDAASESDIYLRAQREVQTRMYSDAIKTYRDLETRFPFGRYAEQAQLELIYVHLQNNEGPDAMAAADRFLRLHPQHPQADYAMYLKGLAAYQASTSLLQRFLPLGISNRDLGAAHEAYDILGQFVQRYPTSPYAADARQRLVYIRDLIANGELDIARYYEARRMRVAAVNRAAWVVKNMPESVYAPDALAIMARNYYGLGLKRLADDTVAILRLNRPNHPSLNKDGTFRFRDKDRFATPES